MTNKAQINDTRIKEMIIKVEAQRESLGSRPAARWRTNGLINLDRHQTNLNILSTEAQLLECFAALLSKKNRLEEAAKMLQIPLVVQEIDGYSLQDWVEDFKLRHKIIKWTEEKKKLDEAEKKLKSLISEEAKTEMELDSLSKDLGL